MSSIADSLRIVEHVETILVPSSWKSMESKTSTEIRWEEKQFEVCELLFILKSRKLNFCKN